MKRTRKILLSKVCTIARQAMALNSDLTLSEAMKQAWALVQGTDCFILEFRRQSGKKKGQVARKVLTRELSRFYEFKGAKYYPNSSKTYAKEGLTAYIDLARVIATPKFTIIKVWDDSITRRDELVNAA